MVLKEAPEWSAPCGLFVKVRLSIAAGRALDFGPAPEGSSIAAADVREAGRDEETRIKDQRERSLVLKVEGKRVIRSGSEDLDPLEDASLHPRYLNQVTERPFPFNKRIV